MSEDIKDELNRINSRFDNVERILEKLSKREDKRLTKIQVAQKLNRTHNTINLWMKDPARNFPLRGNDGRWSEADIEKWIDETDYNSIE